MAGHATVNQIARFVKEQVGMELTQLHGGHDGLNTSEIDSLYRFARHRGRVLILRRKKLSEIYWKDSE